MFTAEDDKIIRDLYEELMAICDSQDIYKNSDDRENIVRAFELANKAHYNVRRKSGEPYMIHPIAVARIVVAEIGLGVKSVISALLHDVVEDTDYTVEDISALFGPKIAEMVDGLTKMKAASGFTGEGEISVQAENFKKMLLTLSNDVRVIIIKLADRMHNMRTLGSMAPHKQMKILSETMYLFAPLAHRLGLYTVKSELEDLSLKFSYPEDYQRIKEKLDATQELRSNYIEKLIAPIAEQLTAAGIDYEISGRIKSIYSIWRKMQRKQITLDEIYDLFAIRIIFNPVEFVPEKTQSWHIYSIVTDIYKPRPDRLREWINIPKANGYEALHCTVMGNEGRWAEVQIRSRRMDDIAEKGFAAHWKYKDRIHQEGELDKWIKEVRVALETPSNDAVEFLDVFQLNLYSSEIVIFTPKGATKTLPKGATALDFAYDIHTKVGNTAIGAKINYKTQSLYKQLESGDQVEIITSKSGAPKVEWLQHVYSAKAKSSIKNYLKRVREANIKEGKKQFEKLLDEMKIDELSPEVFGKINQSCGGSKDDFYAELGSGNIDISDVKQRIKSNVSSGVVKSITSRLNKTLKKLGGGVAPKEVRTVSYKVAECCMPNPGDDVIGIKCSNGYTIVVHKKNCREAIKKAAQHGTAIVATSWSADKFDSYISHLKIKGIDREGMVLDIANVLSRQLNINIRKMNLEGSNGAFHGQISIYVKSNDVIEHIVSKIKVIKGVSEVTHERSIVVDEK